MELTIEGWVNLDEKIRLKHSAWFDKLFPPKTHESAPYEPYRDTRTFEQKEVDEYRDKNRDEHTQVFIHTFDDVLEDMGYKIKENAG